MHVYNTDISVHIYISNTRATYVVHVIHIGDEPGHCNGNGS